MRYDCNENRFDIQTMQLINQENSKYPLVQSNYLWGLESKKQTLRELEKEVYYALGDYPNSNSSLVQSKKRAQYDFEK